MRASGANWIVALLAPLAVVIGLARLEAHEGHDHGASLPPVSKTVAPRAEASSADFELVVVARDGELTIHLDAFRTNAPISGATMEIDTPSGRLTPNDKGKGVYAATAPFLSTPGSYDLAITITAGETIDILAATLVIPKSEPGVDPSAPTRLSFMDSAIAQDIRQRVAGGSSVLWVALGIGFIAGAVVMRLLGSRSRLAVLVALAGLNMTFLPPTAALADEQSKVATRDVAQRVADGILFVPKPTQHLLSIKTQFAEGRVHQRSIELPGRIIPSPNASGLVQASIGGRLLPPDGGFKPLGTPVKAGAILAYVRPPLPLADATAQQQQARELDQQISITSRKVERLRAIEQVVAKSQLEEAELELIGLRIRRANLDRVQREPESLVAPVDGIIAAATAVAGQMAEPSAIIFQIIDPAVLWVEALSYEALALSGAARALLPDGRTVALKYLGSGFADRNQAVPIQFAVDGPTTGLRLGQFLTVLASTSDERKGIAVPREAVLRSGNGQSIVFEHSSAERFTARDVRTEPLDGTHVLVLAGIEPGRRIVTQGAELLNQIR